MSKNKVSSKEVEDAFFLLNHLSPRVKSLDLPHTRGWSSPLPDAMMNRVGMLGGRAEDVFAQAQQFFQERKQGFTWVMDSHCKLPRASSWMARRSMGHTCTIKGMYLDDLKKSATVPDSILLEEIPRKEALKLEDTTARLFGLSRKMARIIFLDSFTPLEKGLCSRVYGARQSPRGEIIAFAQMLYLKDSPYVLLRVAAVDARFRGRGIYKALLARRLRDAIADGKIGAIIHAVEGTTSSVCSRFGFEEVCQMELFHSIGYGKTHK